MNQISRARLSEFLVEAKRKTYAGLDDDATVLAPLLPGSKQLEYRDRDLSYRDIYFGMRFFVGQETVQAGRGRHLVDELCGRRRIPPSSTATNFCRSTPSFVRRCLLFAMTVRFAARRSSRMEASATSNTSLGDVAEFHGEEQIYRAGMKVYGLRYSGGLVR